MRRGEERGGEGSGGGVRGVGLVGSFYERGGRLVCRSVHPSLQPSIYLSLYPFAAAHFVAWDGNGSGAGL